MIAINLFMENLTDSLPCVRAGRAVILLFLHTIQDFLLFFHQIVHIIQNSWQTPKDRNMSQEHIQRNVVCLASYKNSMHSLIRACFSSRISLFWKSSLLCSNLYSNKTTFDLVSVLRHNICCKTTFDLVSVSRHNL